MRSGRRSADHWCDAISGAPGSTAEAVARAKDAAERVVAPLVERTDSGEWPAEQLRALEQAGLGGPVAPRSSGGAGLGLRALAAVCESLGRVCASTVICYGMHSVGTAVVAAKATDRQAKGVPRPDRAGEDLTTLALSEPGTGAQFWLPQTRATRVEGGVQLDGEKSFVTNGSHADSYVLACVGTPRAA